MDDSKKYEGDVANAAIVAILNLYPDQEGAAGVIAPIGAIRGLCYAMGLIAMNTGMYQTPSKRRELADSVRKQLICELKLLTEAKEAGVFQDWPDATLIDAKRH